MGIPVRIALNKDILSLEVKENRLKDLQKTYLFMRGRKLSSHV